MNAAVLECDLGVLMFCVTEGFFFLNAARRMIKLCKTRLDNLTTTENL
jgi:hypothetical protein